MKKNIKTWIQNVVQDGSWKKYNDLHIDKINPNYKEKNSWFNGGIDCYNCANNIIKELGIPYIIELSFPLKSKKIEGDYMVKNLAELNKAFEHAPPSLYIFHENWEGLKLILEKGVKMAPIIEMDKGAFYYTQSYNERDKEVRRVVYLL